MCGCPRDIDRTGHGFPQKAVDVLHAENHMEVTDPMFDTHARLKALGARIAGLLERL